MGGAETPRANLNELGFDGGTNGVLERDLHTTRLGVPCGASAIWSVLCVHGSPRDGEEPIGGQAIRFDLALKSSLGNAEPVRSPLLMTVGLLQGLQDRSA